MSFVSTVTSVLQSKNEQLRTAAELIELWQDFVEECEDGYCWTIYEYDNDISIRSSIQVILDSVNFQQHKEYEVFKNEVNIIDTKFKSLLSHQQRNNYLTWFEKGILKQTGPEYVANIMARYKIKID